MSGIVAEVVERNKWIMNISRVVITSENHELVQYLVNKFKELQGNGLSKIIYDFGKEGPSKIRLFSVKNNIDLVLKEAGIDFEEKLPNPEVRLSISD
jgi:hypothetical protein